MAKKVLCIPDLHAPWSEKRSIEFIESIAIKTKPDIVLQLGDALDLFSYSKFPHDPNIYTPKQELDLGVQFISTMWKNIQKLLPKAKCIQLIGNHEVRLSKRIMDALPAASHLNDWLKFMNFKGVTTIKDPRGSYSIDGVLYTHGFLTNPGAHLGHFGRNVVFGHTHRSWVNYKNIGGKTCFEMSCGHLADSAHALPLQYTPSKHTNWATGIGCIDELGPRFVSIK